MKYIRTKDGHIYEKPPFSKSISQRTLQPIIIGKNGYEEVFAQADTIEELCDEFIIFGDIERPYLTRHKFANKEWNKQYFIGDRKLYGAIWTDKGLIYVAKMNGDGVLCLI